MDIIKPNDGLSYDTESSHSFLKIIILILSFIFVIFLSCYLTVSYLNKKGYIKENFMDIIKGKQIDKDDDNKVSEKEETVDYSSSYKVDTKLLNMGNETNELKEVYYVSKENDNYIIQKEFYYNDKKIVGKYTIGELNINSYNDTNVNGIIDSSSVSESIRNKNYVTKIKDTSNDNYYLVLTYYKMYENDTDYGNRYSIIVNRNGAEMKRLLYQADDNIIRINTLNADTAERILYSADLGDGKKDYLYYFGNVDIYDDYLYYLDLKSNGGCVKNINEYRLEISNGKVKEEMIKTYGEEDLVILGKCEGDKDE